MNTITTQVLNRRDFLRRAGQYSAASAAMPWLLNMAAMGEAAAFNTANGTDYKALVCLFLYGGNDYANTLVPYDSTSYGLYSAARSNLALARADLTSTVLNTSTNVATSTVLTPQAPPQVVSGSGSSLQFALHPVMPEMASLFNSQKAAVVFNVGPLAGPTTLAEYYNGKRPLNLYSHSDQQNYWQSGPVLGSGWGGRAADAALAAGLNGASGANTFSCVSITSNSAFLTGMNASQYHVGTSGAVKITPAYSAIYGNASAASTITSLIRGAANPPTHKLEIDYVNMVKRAMDAETTVTQNVNTQTIAATLAPGKTALNPLWDQLRMVAKMIKTQITSANTLGVRRQVFMVAVNGFDLHSNFTNGQKTLLAQVNDAVDAFYRATVELGVQNQVTTFTASDFGRALLSNGDGSDHGWGGHNFVIGGAVKGGRYYGYAPPMNGSANTQNSTKAEEQFNVGNGRLLPTISVEQYGATLASWFGATDAEIDGIFPTLSSRYGAYASTPYPHPVFGANGVKYPRDLGFMQPYSFA